MGAVVVAVVVLLVANPLARCAGNQLAGKFFTEPNTSQLQLYNIE